MALPFLDRDAERRRLRAALDRSESSFVCLYGRRRCGKTRLLQECRAGRPAVYHLADEREPSLQRSAIAGSIAELLPGFDRVAYPAWPELLERWYRDAPPGAVLALDEFPYLARSSPELPSLLQRFVDHDHGKPVHLILCGSSQRMMQGLVLEATAPLYGRAIEILPIGPLGAGWIGEALELADPRSMVEAFAAWGGVPRYWELAADQPSTWDAIEHHVLSPLGVLHHEPSRVLLDDVRDLTQAASLLSLIGAGCHRLSEIAGRIGKPAGSLTRPLRRLEDLRLVRRDQPFGAIDRHGKKTLYRIDDPFLAFWYRFVEPNRSVLRTRPVASFRSSLAREWSHHVASVWEELARSAVPRLALDGESWMQASRWWGPGLDHRPLELDLVAASSDGSALLVGEVKLSLAASEVPRALAELRGKADRLPFASAYREVLPRIFAVTCPSRSRSIVSARQVLGMLR